MKIGIYNPYLDTVSGGERYTTSLASHWSKKHEVNIFWDNPDILSQLSARFDLDLTQVKVVRNIFLDKNVFKKILESRVYDVLLYLSDGSIPTVFAKHTILHFQQPFSDISFPFYKKMHIDKIVCNSDFTKQYLDPNIRKESIVIYPPVTISDFNDEKKQNIILSVGRFSKTYNAKKHEVLIENFKNCFNRKLWTNWKLVIAGGLLAQDAAYFQSLQDLASGAPIQLVSNISRSELIKLYNTAKLYWHAAGYGERNPQYMEHFGIAVVEAMAAGCIPIVVNAGGIKEIVQDGANGYLWNTPKELLEKSEYIIQTDPMYQQIKQHAIQSSKRFDQEVFFKNFDELITTFSV